MIEGQQLLIENDGTFYFVNATLDIDSFSATPNNTTEFVTDPELLATLYSATRGLILSEKLLYPIGENVVSQTNDLTNLFLDLKRIQSLDIFYDSLIGFNDLLSATVSGYISIKSGSNIGIAEAAADIGFALGNLREEVQTDAYVLALIEASLQFAEDATSELIQLRTEVFSVPLPSTTEIEALTKLTLEVVTLQQVVGELANLFLSEDETPWWQLPYDVLRPWLESALEAANFSKAVVSGVTVEGWAETFYGTASNLVDGAITEFKANEIFFSISDRLQESTPTFYSEKELYETAIRFGLDGPVQSSSGQFVDAEGALSGTINLSAPTFMGDGDAEYTISLSGIGQGLQYNIAYIIDVSGSMGGQRIVDARNAYIELTNQLKTLGIADVANFAVIPFNSGSTLYDDLTADEAIARLSSLGAGGGTSFGPALSDAQTFFSSATAGQTNIAYFLSDGQGSGASDFLTDIANVQAFGIGSGANLGSLNIIDSDDAIALNSSRQLVDVLTGSGASVDEIDGIAISVDGNVVDFITPDQLVDGPLGLQYKGTISGLDVSQAAQNEVTATVFLKGVDGAKGSTTLSIASAFGDTAVTQSGDEARVVLSAFNTSYNADDGSTSNVNLLANNLDNEIIATSTGGIFSLYDGDDYFLSSQTAGSTIDRVIDGGEGRDVVEYLEEFYSGFVRQIGNIFKVGENSDTLTNVEEIRFSNAVVYTGDFVVEYLNSPPVAIDDIFNVDEDQTLTGNVLDDNGNGADSDPDGDSLTVSLISGPAEGMLTLNDDGSFSYEADADIFDLAAPGDVIEQSFSYQIDDGNDEVDQAIATISVNILDDGETISAKNGKDDVFGTDGGEDILEGGNGKDRIFGLDGADHLYGGNGKDLLDGGEGPDKLYGGNGKDILIGGLGDDELTGGKGSDTFVFALGEGTDTVLDYEVGKDLIGLVGLKFEDLSIGQSGDDATISADGEVLAVLIAVDYLTLGETDVFNFV